MVGAVVGSLVGGAVGAAIWAAVGFFTGYEVGWIAWGVGVLAGLGANVGSNVGGGGPSTGTGVLAAVVALAAVGAGKLAVIEIHYQNDPDLATTTGFTDEVLLSYVAEQFGEQWDEAGIYVEWPEIPESQWYRWKESENPPELWAEAEMWWAEQTPETQAQARVGFQKQYQDDVDEIEELYAQWGGEGFLSGFDALWILFAVGSAFGIGRGGGDE